MPYPFLRAMRYKEFIEKLQALGVEVKQSQSPVKNGQDHIDYLSYVADARINYVPLTFAGEDEIVQWPVVRSICSSLKLDPTIFGLALDEKPGQETDSFKNS